MSSQRIRLLFSVVVAGVGLGLAWRALDRSGEPAVTRVPFEVAANVEESLSFDGLAFIALSPENTPSLLEELRTNALAAIDLDALPAVVRQEQSRIDLADAFRARLGGFLKHDFDSSLEDMIARGWPRYSNKIRDKQRERWEGEKERLAQMRIDPASLQVRSIDSAHDSLDGYSRSCSGSTPLDEETRAPIAWLGEVGEAVVELRFRAVLPDVDGVATSVLLGYRFTWDEQFERWRWIQTCVYRRPGDGAFAAMRPI